MIHFGRRYHDAIDRRSPENPLIAVKNRPSLPVQDHEPVLRQDQSPDPDQELCQNDVKDRHPVVFLHGISHLETPLRLRTKARWTL